MELKDITKEVALVSENATLEDALRAMINQQSNTLVVIDPDGRLSGEVHVSDLLDAVVPDFLDGDSVLAHFSDEEQFEKDARDAATKPVSEFMTMDVESIKANESLLAVATHAVSHKSAQIPVVDEDDRPIGIISRRGLKQILGEFLNIKE